MVCVRPVRSASVPRAATRSTRWPRTRGGELYDNFNNLGEAMGQMLDRTSVTYLLAFQPKNLKFDGKYRKLKIKLKGTGPRAPEPP